MNRLLLSAECRPLQMQWAEQFIKESELTIVNECITEAAQTVLFYAGLLLELEGQNDSERAYAEQTSWLAAEEEVVEQVLPYVPKMYHGLLKLCLMVSSLNAELELEPGELAAIRGNAYSFIAYVRGRTHQLADWFH
ncbi:hypothetical protein DVH26_03695 [Paenibacillus sp. H1-7]|uniref:hypothetical protein n=1 Tax=Paenibacillus sp. H1-7 TaxID=2282849 RepID=UPI001EF81A72|nr:hypothetical protein [Paenibacillus sp. H1-7]ULL13630.1 hypothetical protein DVH26_03695 [Paenibacillus sp. H1-7]